MRRYYSLSLSEIGSDKFQWWQVKGLLENLPRDSAMVRDMLGEATEWTVDTHLLAHIADGIWAGVWQRGSGKKKDRPKPIPRPGDKPKSIGTVKTIAEIDAMRKRIRRG